MHERPNSQARNKHDLYQIQPTGHGIPALAIGDCQLAMPCGGQCTESHFSISVFQRFSISVFQCFSVSAFKHSPLTHSLIHLLTHCHVPLRSPAAARLGINGNLQTLNDAGAMAEKVMAPMFLQEVILLGLEIFGRD